MKLYIGKKPPSADKGKKVSPSFRNDSKSSDIPELFSARAAKLSPKSSMLSSTAVPFVSEGVSGSSGPQLHMKTDDSRNTKGKLNLE